MALSFGTINGIWWKVYKTYITMFIRDRRSSSCDSNYRKRVMELVKANQLLQINVAWLKSELLRRNDELEKAKGRVKVMITLLETEFEKVNNLE